MMHLINVHSRNLSFQLDKMVRWHISSSAEKTFKLKMIVVLASLCVNSLLRSSMSVYLP